MDIKSSIQIPEQLLALSERVLIQERESQELIDDITRKSEESKRLNDLVVASIQLLSDVDSSADDTQMSSARCLSLLDRSTAVSPVEKPKTHKQTLSYEFQMDILSKLAKFAETHKNDEEISMSKLNAFNNDIVRKFHMAEEQGIMARVDYEDESSWKYKMLQIVSILKNVTARQLSKNINY